MTEHAGDRDLVTIERAVEAITGRGATHGPIEEEAELVAAFWSDYLGVRVEPHETREMMLLMKLARSKAGGPALQHHEDMVGYAELASQLSPYRRDRPPLELEIHDEEPDEGTVDRLRRVLGGEGGREAAPDEEGGGEQGRAEEKSS